MDMIRGYKPDLPLPLDEEGELYQGNVLVTPSEGMQDPLYELEQKERGVEYIRQVVDVLRSLPPCQRRVMICSLKDQLDDVLTLAQVFKNFEINIEAERWPSKKKEVQNLPSAHHLWAGGLTTGRTRDLGAREGAQTVVLGSGWSAA
jgi:hypothetical protein